MEFQSLDLDGTLYDLMDDGTYGIALNQNSENRENVLIINSEEVEVFDDEEKVNEWLFMDGVYYPALNTKKLAKLEPGFYSVGYEQGKFFAIPENLELDEVYKMQEQSTDKIIKEIDDFWKKKNLYKRHKIVHKRGILLVGPPGTGKTSTINLLAQQAIENGGVVFHIGNVNELSMLVTFINTYMRQIQPDTPVITIIEDIDNMVSSAEPFLLSFLDGENQLEHNVTIGTSNRPQLLNDLLLRPSRFDWVIEVGMPNEDSRRTYFEKKGIPADKLDEFVKETDGYSMAHLKEVFITTQLLDYTLQDAIDKLDTQEKNIQVRVGVKKSEKVGF